MRVHVNHRPLRSILATTACLALTVAACSGDDDSAEDTAAATADDTSAETDGTDPSGSASDDDTDADSDDIGEPTPEEIAALPQLAPSSLTLADQDGDGSSVTIDGVELPADGFIAVHAESDGAPGDIIGVSGLLTAGPHEDVTITLDTPLPGTGTVFPMIHIDTDANGVYEFGIIDGVDGPGLTDNGDVAVGPIVITIDGGGGSAAGQDDANAITIADFAFSGVTEVPVGTTVIVTNDDGTAHTWSAVGGTFDSGSLAPGDTFEFTFDEVGEFEYFCNFHPSMTGTITVTG